jgi:hypothetical protein
MDSGFPQNGAGGVRNDNATKIQEPTAGFETLFLPGVTDVKS